jgi:DNA-binding CsgD family transcriptional regulator
LPLVNGPSASRLQKVLHAVTQAVELRELSEFRAGAVELVRGLVPCDSASYNEVKPGAGAIVVAEPTDWLTAENTELFGRLAGQNPLISHYTRTGDGQPVRFSDFVSRSRLHRLALYDQLYRTMGIEYQIAFVLPSPPGEVIGIALNRQRHDFTSEDAASLDLLRVPLQACYQRLLEREQLTSRLAAYESASDVTVRMLALGLSDREVEVIQNIIDGASNAEVGMSLGISKRTVEKHLQNIYLQLDVTSRTQAVRELTHRLAAADSR